MMRSRQAGKAFFKAPQALCTGQLFDHPFLQIQIICQKFISFRTFLYGDNSGLFSTAFQVDSAGNAVAKKINIAYLLCFKPLGHSIKGLVSQCFCSHTFVALEKFH